MSKEAPEQTLETFLHSEIPLTRAMGVRVEKSDTSNLILSAPLKQNHNHLGTAFGGSLATMATLAGYCALWTALGDRKIHIVIRRSSIEYLHPVTGEIRASCIMPSEGKLLQLRKTLAAHGKARLKLEVVITESSTEHVRFSGDFVALV